MNKGSVLALYANTLGVSRKFSVARFTWVLAVLLALCLSTPRLHAQATASVTGTVTDTSGAVVVGATVTAKNVSTGFARAGVTNDQGIYNIPSLPIGSYSLTAVQTGFKQAEVPAFVLQVAQQARINLSLSPGNVKETVTVSGAAPLLQTESSSVSDVVAVQQIQGLPLNSRHVAQLIQLTPGAITSPLNGAVNSNNGGPLLSASNLALGRPEAAIAGGGASHTDYLFDGIDNTEFLFNGLQYEPSEDFVQEFKVISNNAPAQYGRGSAVVLMSSRNGTNQIHGSAFEFNRTDTPGFTTDARNRFAGTAPVASLHQNQFGGSLGGPIIKDHLFYFINYEGVRQSIPATQNVIVPTLALRSGDFSGADGGVLQGNTLAPGAIDPYTGQPISTSWANGGTQVPANELDPVTQYILGPNCSICTSTNHYFVPLPNQPDNLHFTYSPDRNLRSDQGNARIDFQLSQSDMLFGRVSIQDITAYSPGPTPYNGGTSQVQNNRDYAVGYTHTFSPTLLNELHFGYEGFYSANSPQGLGTNYTTQFGILGYQAESAQYPGFPNIYLGGDYQILNGNDFAPLINPTHMYEVTDTLTWTTGKHTLSFGFDMRYYHFTSTNSAHSRGNLTFNSNNFTGNGFVNFLLGLPNNGSRDFPRNIFGEKDFEFPLFVQDDWKVTKNLTVNLGLRYDLSAAPVQDYGQNSYWDQNRDQWVVSNYHGNLPNLVTQGIAQTAYNAFSTMTNQLGFPTMIVSPASVGLPNNIESVSRKSFAPRIGFAYRPFGSTKTVIRAGYGIFYDMLSGNYSVSQTLINIPFIWDESRVHQTGTINTAAQGDSNTFAQFFNFPVGGTGLPDVSQKDVFIKPPYNQQWNFSIQHQFSDTLSFEIGYLGNKGTHLDIPMPINTNRWVNGVNLGPRWTNVAGPSSGLANYTNASNSIYHALEISLNKRFSSGLQFGSNFTWSKLMDESSADEQAGTAGSVAVADPFNLKLNRALGLFDVKFRFTANAIYTLPIGRGMRFGSDMPRGLDYVVGGWRVSVIGIAESGTPFSVTQNEQPFSTSDYGTLPNQLRSGTALNPTINKWFDPTAFVVNPTGSGVLGTERRNSLRGPGEDIWDASVMKEFHLTESKYFELRADAFNVFNHPWFAQPAANIDNLSQVGKITRTAVSTNSRELQGSLKFYF